MKHLQTLYAITTTTQLLFLLITIGWCALSDQVSMSIVVGAAAGALFYERNEAVMRGALRQVIRWDLLFLAVNLVVLITQTVLVHFALISYRTLGSLAGFIAATAGVAALFNSISASNAPEPGQ
ncbi:MAG: hypothetical protein HFF00_02815 [Ruminiclostridium sp.]|jgi:hypothetical protein|nr:hypothetical protein [Ruminiclostridium sp.]